MGGALGSLFGSNKAADDAEKARKEQEDQEKAQLQEAEKKRTSSMRSRFTGGALSGSDTLG